jgi:hypothetical protein
LILKQQLQLLTWNISLLLVELVELGQITAAEAALEDFVLQHFPL